MREREVRGVDCAVLLGELDRDAATEDVDDCRSELSPRLSAVSDSVGIKGSADWRGSGNRGFVALMGEEAGENEGGGLTGGGASSGEVMDAVETRRSRSKGQDTSAILTLSAESVWMSEVGEQRVGRDGDVLQ